MMFNKITVLLWKKRATVVKRIKTCFAYGRFRVSNLGRDGISCMRFQNHFFFSVPPGMISGRLAFSRFHPLQY